MSRSEDLTTVKKVLRSWFISEPHENAGSESEYKIDSLANEIIDALRKESAWPQTEWPPDRVFAFRCGEWVPRLTAYMRDGRAGKWCEYVRVDLAKHTTERKKSEEDLAPVHVYEDGECPTETGVYVQRDGDEYTVGFHFEGETCAYKLADAIGLTREWMSRIRVDEGARK